MIAAAFLAAALTFLPQPAPAQTPTLRVGHFPNVTHVQAMVAHALSRQGNGWFEARTGATIEWYVYNAGPSAMEALFARSIDLTYVGPSPAINAYAKSNGDEVRIVAGAIEGGTALVVQGDSVLAKPADFRGKKIATPQLGNTQDVAARAWLVGGGLKITQTGGDAQVIPTANPDQLALFKQRYVDAVWTVEPWVTRLVTEAGGRILVEDRNAVTTVLVARAEVLAKNRALVKSFVAAQAELTDWIVGHPREAQELLRAELAAETRAAVSEALIAQAWPRIVPAKDVSREVLGASIKSAQAVGFLRHMPDAGRLIESP